MHIATQTNSDYTALAERYDAKVRALYDEIRQLHESRNADCSSTRNLPAEVLSLVFQRLATSGRYRRSVSWISATHVCRKWRHIALGEPNLWTNTVGLRTQLLELFLSRAKASPLKIVYGDYSGYDSDSSFDGYSDSSESSTSSGSSLYSSSTHAVLEDLLLSSPQRLRKLKLIDCDSEIVDRLDQPAPYLTSLSIHGKIFISPTFLGNCAPRLQSLVLRQGSISLDTSWLCQLRTLDLAEDWRLSDSVGNRHPINTTSFLQLLSTLGKLEDLSVSFVGGASHHEYSGVLIRLPNLRTGHFKFATETFQFSDLFDHIQLPSIHRLCVEWPYHFSHSASRIEKISTFFAENTGRPLRQVSFSSGNSHRRCDMESSSVEGGPTLLMKNIPVTSGLPLQNSNTIKELEIRAFEALAILLETSKTTLLYPSITQLTVHAVSLKRKTVMPVFESWLRNRNSMNNVIEKLIISGSEGLLEKDLASLEKLVQLSLDS